MISSVVQTHHYFLQSIFLDMKAMVCGNLNNPVNLT